MFYLTGFVKSLEFWKNGKKVLQFFFQSFNNHFIGEFFFGKILFNLTCTCVHLQHIMHACSFWKNKLLLKKHVWKKS